MEGSEQTAARTTPEATVTEPSPRREIALLQSCFIGCSVAICAVLLRLGVGWLGAVRIHLSEQFPTFVVLPLFGLIGGAICGAIIQKVAPEITGSGIPQVKAVLSGHEMSMSWRVAGAKLAAGILALGAGFPLGREGPTVQIGACMAGTLADAKLIAQKHRRHLIAAGAGAGLAAAFNAPLAGLLFVIEELLRDVSSFTVGNAALAAFFAAVVARALGNLTLNLDEPAAPAATNFFLFDVPFLVALGVVAGILGTVFNQGIIYGTRVNSKLLQHRYIMRVSIAGLLCGLAIAALPGSFHDFAGLKHFLTTGEPTFTIAATAFAANFLLTLVAYTSGAPGGLFAPCLTIGAALGYMMGMLEKLLLPDLAQNPHIFALAGMGAFFCGVARVPITSTVIVFEIATDFNLFLPLMISCITAFFVGEALVSGSIYDRLLELQGIKLPRHEGDTARDDCRP